MVFKKAILCVSVVKKFNELARIPARLVLDSVETDVRVEEQTSMFA